MYVIYSEEYDIYKYELINSERVEVTFTSYDLDIVREIMELYINANYPSIDTVVVYDRDDKPIWAFHNTNWHLVN